VTGSESLGITRDRFLKLARAGCFRPARWYVNQYRAVVWLYPGEEVAAFADEHPEWLTGRLPEEVRARLAEGLDLRAPGWRLRRAAQLASHAPDAWHEAAVWLALLGPEQAADLVADDAERLRLVVPRPTLLPDRPEDPRPPALDGPPAVALTAQDPQEIAYARRSLSAALARARAANRCSRTVTQAGQRPKWPASLFSSRYRAPHGTARRQRGLRRALARSVRPDQSKGRR
jgi:hypothetical protein